MKSQPDGYPANVYGRPYVALSDPTNGNVYDVAWVIWWNPQTTSVWVHDIAADQKFPLSTTAVDPAAVQEAVDAFLAANGLSFATQQYVDDAIAAVDSSTISGTLTVGQTARALNPAVDDVNIDPDTGVLSQWDGTAWNDVYTFGSGVGTVDLSDYVLAAQSPPYVDDVADLPDDAPVGAAFVVGPERILYVVPDTGTPAPFNAATKDAITATDVMRMIADNDVSVDEKIEALKTLVNGLKMSQFALQAYVLHGDGKQAYNDWTTLPVNGTPYSLSPPQFRVRHGFLEVRGTVAIGKTTGNTSVATLPADCPKPVMEQSFAVACRESGVQGRSGYVTVGAGGNFNFQTANANAVNEISFNGIRVEVKQNA